MDWKNLLVNGLEMLFLGIGAIYDKRDRQIPVRILWIFSGILLAGRLLWIDRTGNCSYLSFLPGIVCLFAGWITGEKIGYGDGWGILILGLSGNFRRLFRMLMIAFLISGFWGLWNRIIRKRSLEDTIPFYLCLFAARIGVML